MDVAPGTVVIFSDIGCPWAHAAAWLPTIIRDQPGASEELVTRAAEAWQ